MVQRIGFTSNILGKNQKVFLYITVQLNKLCLLLCVRYQSHLDKTSNIVAMVT